MVSQFQGLQVAWEVRNAGILDQSCLVVNALEARVDAEGGLSSPTLGVYEGSLADWRAFWRGARPQPSCRVEALGISLCEAGTNWMPEVNPKAWNLTSQWARHMYALADRERSPTDCREFARFHENGWAPPLWQWAERTPGLEGALLEALVEDPEYEAYYAAAAGRAPAFGSPAVETLQRPQGAFRRKRVQELVHLRVLRRSAGLAVTSLTHIVEFGGGTGETAAAIRDLGFVGRHVIIDLPPMLLLQRYWLRYSGLPAYLSDDKVTKEPAASWPGIVLESAASSSGALARHLEGADPRQSLFLGLWSLTEAGLGARAKVWPLVAACGFVLLAFGNEFDGVDNAQHLRVELQRWGLAETHHLLSWHLVQSPGHFYLLAVRKDIGPVACLPELNCEEATQHKHLALR